MDAREARRRIFAAIGVNDSDLNDAHRTAVDAVIGSVRREALEAAKEAERQIVEYSEIDLLDTTPERLRIARRIRALATPTKPGDETK